MIGNNIQAALVEVAARLMQKMKTKVSQNNLPKAISDATYATQPKKDGKFFSISVIIDLQNAPMAAAFEWGSGIWGDKGQRYKIAPKNKRALAFEYEVGKNIPGDIPNLAAEPIRYSKKTGKAVFPYVMHPGVRAKPYIEPSIIENREDAKRILGRAFIEAFGVGGNEKYRIQVM